MDVLYFEGESPAAKIKRLALAKICETLRDIGSQINKINGCPDLYPFDVQELCTRYFNLYAMIFSQHCQLTVWTMGYAVPYFVRKLFSEFSIGYGIVSMQGKEAKHSSLKQELRTTTNRSMSHDTTGKWHQVFRANYVRKFYLPFHFPIDNYHSHYRQRKALHDDGKLYCECSRKMFSDFSKCTTCTECIPLIQCITDEKFSANNINAMKPFKCELCSEQFADESSLNAHHKNHIPTSAVNKLVPLKMSFPELREELKKRGKPVNGTKKQLQIRLEGAISACK